MLPKGLLKEHHRLLSFVMRCLDMSMIFFAGWVAYLVKFDTLNMPAGYLVAITIGMCVATFVFSANHLYASVRGKGFFSHFFNLFQGLIITGLLIAGVASLTKSGEAYSRVWFGFWMGFSLLFLISLRCSVLYFLSFMRSHGLNERKVVILGAGTLGLKFAETVQQALWTGFRIVNFFDDYAHLKPKELQGIPVLQTPPDLGHYLTQHKIDEIWLALPFSAEDRVKTVLHELRHHFITTRYVLDIFRMDLLSHSITEIAGLPVLNIRSTPMYGLNRFCKALEDRILAAFILLLISPLLILIALSIKLTSKGPIFFRQQRLGRDGHVITIYKFRTMYMHEEQLGKVTQATHNDKRVTPLGKFLRRSSLDELPQFFNVLQGRMSIVGPRPHALAHNELYKETVHTYMQRHRVKPGITGWAQVNGWRGETDTVLKMEKRVEYDLYYINNWSLGFDLKIILLTLFKGFVNRNAY